MSLTFLMHKTSEDYPDLYSLIRELEARVHFLENENIGTTNSLYELENRIDSIVQNNLGHFSLGDK